MTTHEVHARVEQVHRAAFAFRTAGRFAIQLGHHSFGRYALGDCLSMLAITGDNVIVTTKRGYGPDPNCFLADVQMTEAANLSNAVRFGALLFKTPNQQHLMKDPEQQLTVVLCDRLGVLDRLIDDSSRAGGRVLLALSRLTAHG